MNIRVDRKPLLTRHVSTDDPREAVVLTHDAFKSIRKQLRNRRDESALASILISAVIRAGLTTA